MFANVSVIAERVTAIARMIAAHAGDPSSAVRSFTICIEALERSCWPDVAWRFSELMRGGGPIEFVFSSSDSALRYTVEVAGPELPNHSRLDAACALMMRLGHAPPPADLVQAWRSLQADSSLAWGTWLGVRHDRAGERAKIYVETPPGTRSPIAPLSVLSPLPGSRLQMIGYEPSRGRAEVYFCKAPAERADLEALLRGIESVERRQALVAGLAELCGLPIDTALRWVTLGYSLAHCGNTDIPELALFVRAKAVVGGAASVRRKLLSWQSRSDQRTSPYRDLVGSLADHALPDHGILTLGLRAGGELELRAGISGVALAERLAACEVRGRGPRDLSGAWPRAAAPRPAPPTASPAPDVHAAEFASVEMLQEFAPATLTREDIHA